MLMSGVDPSSFSSGVLHPRDSNAVLFTMKTTYCMHENHVSGGAPVELSTLLVYPFISWNLLSAKFWCWHLGSDCQPLMHKCLSTCLTWLLTSLYALSVISTSIAPLVLMLSSSEAMKSPSLASPTTSQTLVLVPTKNWATQYPLASDGVSEYTVSVATASFRF